MSQQTTLPPVVIAGLYKQIVIPATEAAALAEANSRRVGAADVMDRTGLEPATVDVTTGPTDLNPAPAALKEVADSTPVPGTFERSKQASVEPKVPVQPLSALADEASISSLSEGSNPSFSADATASSSTYKILGKNLKQVVIIVHSPKEPFLPEDHLQFLTKMLGACQLNLGDVAIVNDATQKVDIQLLKAQLEPARLLLFGVAPAEIGLPLSFPQFKEQEYAGCSYLYSPSLLDLNRTSEETKDLKRKLWESLKKMFNV